MSETTLRKTYKKKLRPTPAQERALEEGVWRCRDRYNMALVLQRHLIADRLSRATKASGTTGLEQ
jgi:hypothetical protein